MFDKVLQRGGVAKRLTAGIGVLAAIATLATGLVIARPAKADTRGTITCDYGNGQTDTRIGWQTSSKDTSGDNDIISAGEECGTSPSNMSNPDNTDTSHPSGSGHWVYTEDGVNGKYTWVPDILPSSDPVYIPSITIVANWGPFNMVNSYWEKDIVSSIATVDAPEYGKMGVPYTWTVPDLSDDPVQRNDTATGSYGRVDFGSVNSGEAFLNHVGYYISSLNTRPDGTGYTYNWGDKITVKSGNAITLYCQWKKMYLAFDPNGGTLVSQKNWFNKQGADLTKPYSVEFQKNKDTVYHNGDPINYIYNVESKDNGPYAVRHGYKLAGWSTNKNGTGNVLPLKSDGTYGLLKKVGLDNIHYNDWGPDENSVVVSMPDFIWLDTLVPSVTWYAQWKKLPGYTITFDANGGVLTGSSTVDVTKGDAVGTLPSVTRAGYTFDGWYTAATGGTKINDSWKPTANTTLYAQWKKSTYTITADANGGTFPNGQSTDTVTVNAGGHPTIPAPTRKGYKFTGWTDEAGKTVDPATWTPTGDSTIHAQWKLVPAIQDLPQAGSALAIAVPALLVASFGAGVALLKKRRA